MLFVVPIYSPVLPFSPNRPLARLYIAPFSKDALCAIFFSARDLHLYALKVFVVVDEQNAMKLVIVIFMAIVAETEQVNNTAILPRQSIVVVGSLLLVFMDGI